MAGWAGGRAGERCVTDLDDEPPLLCLPADTRAWAGSHATQRSTTRRRHGIAETGRPTAAFACPTRQAASHPDFGLVMAGMGEGTQAGSMPGSRVRSYSTDRARWARQERRGRRGCGEGAGPDGIKGPSNSPGASCPQNMQDGTVLYCILRIFNDAEEHAQCTMEPTLTRTMRALESTRRP